MKQNPKFCTLLKRKKIFFCGRKIFPKKKPLYSPRSEYRGGILNRNCPDGVSWKTTPNSAKSWSTQDELPWSLSGVLSPTVSVPFLLKSAQKGVLFGDPENRSFTSETMKVRGHQKIVTKTRSFLYL